MKIADLIGKEPQWRQIYADADCVLFKADKKKNKVPLKKRGTSD